MRNGRRECLDEFKKLKNEKKITEDELKQAETEVQKILNKFTDQVDKMLAQKEKEITEV